MIRRHSWGLVFLVAVLAACSDGGNSPTEPRPARAVLSLAAPSTVAPGQTVNATLTVLNDGDEPLTLTFGSSCRADLVVERGGTRVWDLMSRVLCAFGVTTSTLQPNQTLVYGLQWDQSTNEGTQAQPGTYTLRAVLLANDRPQSAPVTLAIQ